MMVHNCPNGSQNFVFNLEPPILATSNLAGHIQRIEKTVQKINEEKILNVKNSRIRQRLEL